jgi:hypothetical protein
MPGRRPLPERLEANDALSSSRAGITAISWPGCEERLGSGGSGGGTVALIRYQKGGSSSHGTSIVPRATSR